MLRCVMEGIGEREGKEEKESGGEEEREKPVTCQAQLLHPAMGEWSGNTAVRTGCWALGSLEGELESKLSTPQMGSPKHGILCSFWLL